MPVFTYTFSTMDFSDPADNTVIITTEPNLSTVSLPGDPDYQGYVVTGVSGTFSGQSITGLLGQGGTFNQDLYPGPTFGENAGFSDNTIFPDDAQGDNGSSHGLDNLGVSFTTADGAHYGVYVQDGAFRYESGGTINPFTLDTSDAPCFASGTLIRTPRGDVAVEALAVGDVVVTASGDERPIRWLGHRAVNCSAHPEPRKIWPVRVAKDAFGPGKPERDLFVSPGHSLCITVLDAMLIPASSLVNGATIARVAVDEVTYWHVELDSHDVLLANGLPAESYLDTGNRAFFAGGSNDPDAEPKTHADFRHPFHHKGPLVEAVRAQLTARAATLGWTEDRAADLHLVVDGKVVRPFGAGDTALFLFPASARDVRLVAKTFVPADRGGADKRRLGVRIHGLSLSGTAGAPRRVSLEDPALFDQFHASEREAARAWRWTQGDLALAPSLWSGLTGDVLLHLTYVFNTVRGYLPPVDASLAVAAAKDQPSLRVVV